VGPAEGTTAAAIEGTDSKGGVMDGERLDAAAAFYANTLAKHPDAWRAIRRTSAIVAAGDVAMESVRNCNFARDWPRERLVAVHEAGHSIMRFFLFSITNRDRMGEKNGQRNSGRNSAEHLFIGSGEGLETLPADASGHLFRRRGARGLP
jgi:hypothetical protein